MSFAGLSMVLLIGVVKIQVHLARYHPFTKDPVENQAHEQWFRRLSKRSFRLMVCSTLFAWFALLLYVEENAGFLRYFRQFDETSDGDYYYFYQYYNALYDYYDYFGDFGCFSSNYFGDSSSSFSAVDCSLSARWAGGWTGKQVFMHPSIGMVLLLSKLVSIYKHSAL